MTNINEWIEEAEKDTECNIYKKTALYILKTLRDSDQLELEIRSTSRIMPAVTAYLNEAGYKTIRVANSYEDRILVKRIVDEPVIDGSEENENINGVRSFFESLTMDEPVIDESEEKNIDKLNPGFDDVFNECRRVKPIDSCSMTILEDPKFVIRSKNRCKKIEEEKGGYNMIDLESIYNTARRIDKSTLTGHGVGNHMYNQEQNLFASFPKSKSTVYKIEKFINKVDTFISTVNEFKQTIDKSSLNELELTNFYISKIADIYKILDFKYEKELTSLEVEIFNDYYDIDSIKLNSMYDYIAYVLRLKVEAFAIIEEYKQSLPVLEELEQVNRIKSKFEKCNKILSDIQF